MDETLVRIKYLNKLLYNTSCTKIAVYSLTLFQNWNQIRHILRILPKPITDMQYPFQITFTYTLLTLYEILLNNFHPLFKQNMILCLGFTLTNRSKHLFNN